MARATTEMPTTSPPSDRAACRGRWRAGRRFGRGWRGRRSRARRCRRRSPGRPAFWLEDAGQLGAEGGEIGEHRRFLVSRCRLPFVNHQELSPVDDRRTAKMNLNVLTLASGLAAHATARQQVISENVAHADTPGYRARDIVDFASTLDAAPAFTRRTTRPGHIFGADPRGFEPGDAAALRGGDAERELRLARGPDDARRRGAAGARDGARRLCQVARDPALDVSRR